MRYPILYLGFRSKQETFFIPRNGLSHLVFVCLCMYMILVRYGGVHGSTGRRVDGSCCCCCCCCFSRTVRFWVSPQILWYGWLAGFAIASQLFASNSNESITNIPPPIHLFYGVRTPKASQSPKEFVADLAFPTRSEFSGAIRTIGGTPTRIAFVGNLFLVTLETIARSGRCRGPSRGRGFFRSGDGESNHFVWMER